MSLTSLMYIAMYKSIDSAFWCAYCKAKLYRWLKMLSEHGVCLLTGIQRTKEAGLEVRLIGTLFSP
jgi:hypothetical protein